MSLTSIKARDPVAAFSIAKTLGLEGGLEENPADPGGITNHGVSLRFALQTVTQDPSQLRWFDMDHDGHVTATDIREMTTDDAADVMFAEIWLPGWYGALGPEMLCWKSFDQAVNTGPRRAGVLLQKALCRLGATVAVDSRVGPITLAAVKAAVAKDQGVGLLAMLRKVQADFYERLCALEPDFVTFKRGWLARAAL